MTNSINHPWGISKKMRERMGQTWADMDFEINPRLSTHNMKEDLIRIILFFQRQNKFSSL